MDHWVEKRILCSENEQLVLFIKQKRQEMAETPKGISDNIDSTIYKAYKNLCDTKTPVKTLSEFKKIKGVGHWMLKLCKDFFKTDSVSAEPEECSPQKGKKSKGKRRYLPLKNSVAYALLITLYRKTSDGTGTQFMKKQELIDATEASGLSRTPIMPERGKGKPIQGGNSGNEWYTGWSAMGGLIKRGLIVKSSNPAKYMLTQEGVEAARECLSKSIPLSRCSVDCNDLGTSIIKSRKNVPDASDLEFGHSNLSDEEVTWDSSSQEKSIAIDEVFKKNGRLDELLSECRQTMGKVTRPSSSTSIVEDMGVPRVPDYSCRVDSAPSSLALKACSSSKPFSFGGHDANMNALMMPPLKFGERFKDVYNVILILDDREHFTKSKNGARSKKIIQNIGSEFKIKVEVRRLPVGDAIWIARNKHLENEFVLDFIVERKEVDDLRMSIRDSRYKDQKLRLLRCGIKKLIYLVEGDPNLIEASEAIKTACFTTEILEGFDVHRTAGLVDTLRRYGYLTQAIAQYYREKVCDDMIENSGTCLPYNEFIKKCEDLEKVTVSDVFAIQLMQVPQVTEEIALSVLDLYPTVVSLARAYSLLDGNVEAQEEMLKRQSNNLISGPASRNIYQLIWGD
ncbi:hypothetical protein MKW92_007659 [Papaver armeniacum]|nr:hypothetical protein MKW92_007659 [Papaver armeniacum]